MIIWRKKFDLLYNFICRKGSIIVNGLLYLNSTFSINASVEKRLIQAGIFNSAATGRDGFVFQICHPVNSVGKKLFKFNNKDTRTTSNDCCFDVLR